MFGEEPKKITNKVDILQLCRDYFRGKGKAKFFHKIHVKNEELGNLNIEGAGVMGVVTTAEDVFIDLTNSDSNYKASIGRVNLFDIQYIQEIE